SETTNLAGVQFGIDCFKQFLGTEQSTSADQFADRLLEELSRWSDRGSAEDLDDDITMVAIHVKSDKKRHRRDFSLAKRARDYS
ncbi:MAG TPA: hypothetical protein VI386_11585, partial [Candidatus Sulfotelmatobacter sp.]